MKKAGRPKAALNLKKMPISLKLPKWLIEWLDSQNQSRAVLIEKALIKQFNIKKPLPNNDLEFDFYNGNIAIDELSVAMYGKKNDEVEKLWKAWKK